jgi:UTP--glucose-1-phosphate uridylyltransferase
MHETTTTVRRALMPVAGRGTRMYPATAAVPKELLPIGTRPILEFALDEVRDAGFDELVLVTAHGKSAIEDFVDDWCARRSDALAVSYVRQREARGLGHAVLVAAHLLRDAPFAVLLPDDLLPGPPHALRDLVAAYLRRDRAAVLVQPIRADETTSYGVPAIRASEGGDCLIDDLVEKPEPSRAPSALGVVGRYVLPPRILERLRALRPGSGGEIQLTDALAALAREETLTGVALRQARIDCGSPSGYLAAQATLGGASARSKPPVAREVRVA